MHVEGVTRQGPEGKGEARERQGRGKGEGVVDRQQRDDGGEQSCCPLFV